MKMKKLLLAISILFSLDTFAQANSADSTSLGIGNIPNLSKTISISPKKTLMTSCPASNGSTCYLYLPNNGLWSISAMAYGHQHAWNGAQLRINGVLVGQNLSHGDQAGTGYGIMTGTLTSYGGPGYIIVTSTFSASWGDNMISIIAAEQ